jgi:hypothetical protein
MFTMAVPVRLTVTPFCTTTLSDPEPSVKEYDGVTNVRLPLNAKEEPSRVQCPLAGIAIEIASSTAMLPITLNGGTFTRSSSATSRLLGRCAFQYCLNQRGLVDAILYGIDGTGPLSDKTYQADMSRSFVSYIVRNSPARVKRYERGPALDGLDMAIIAAKGYEFIHLQRVAQRKAPVFLTGYSRGGAGVIAIAQRLAKDNITVSGMVLFDAVDRAIGIDAAEIPRNVEHVVHARRDPHAFTRDSFSNCGTRWHSPTRCDVGYFRGTHGALGGCPWPIPPEGKSNGFIQEFRRGDSYADHLCSGCSCGA